MSRSPSGRCEPLAFSPSSTLPIDSDTTCCGCWENPRVHNWENLTRRRNRSNVHKGMTPLLTENLKVVGLWVFFLIYCLTFSFLFNVGLKLAVGFLKSPPHLQGHYQEPKLWYQLMRKYRGHDRFWYSIWLNDSLGKDIDATLKKDEKVSDKLWGWSPQDTLIKLDLGSSES